MVCGCCTQERLQPLQASASLKIWRLPGPVRVITMGWKTLTEAPLSAIRERRQLDGQVDGEGRGCGRWHAWAGAQQGLAFAGPTLEREQNVASRCALTAVRLETNAIARNHWRSL